MRDHVHQHLDRKRVGGGDQGAQAVVTPERRFHLDQALRRERRRRGGLAGPVCPVASPLLSSKDVDGGESVLSLDLRQMGGDIRECAQTDDLTVLVVHQARMLAVSPVGAGMSVDVREDLQHQLAAQVGDHVDATAAFGVRHPFAAAAGILACDAEVVVAQLVESITGGQGRSGRRASEIQVHVVQVRLARKAMVAAAAVDPQPVPAAAAREIEAEAVRCTLHQVHKRPCQRRRELLGSEHALQQQVGVIAHLVQIVSGGRDQ